MEDQERRSLRAYIGVVVPDDFVEKSGPQPNPPSFFLELKNGGQTPAYQVTYRNGARFASYPMPANFKFTFKPLRDLLEPITVLSGELGGQGIEFQLTDALTASQLAMIQGEHAQAHIYLFGTVKYLDVFGEQHYTNFCEGFYLRTLASAVLEACSQHNDSN